MPKAELKRVKLDELKPGLRVVVNSIKDTPVYTVDSVIGNGFVAELSYDLEGQKASGGPMDYSCLYHPSKEQLAAHA